MSRTIQVIATELLDLEKTQKNRPFDDREQDRWEELVIEIFGEKVGERPKRRSFRLKSNTKGSVICDGKKYDCDIFELSLRGFSFANKFLKEKGQDFAFLLESIDVLANNVSLGLQCKTVNLTSIGEKFGAVIASGNSSDQLEVYSEKVYYPFYLNYLENLANNNF